MNDSMDGISLNRLEGDKSIRNHLKLTEPLPERALLIGVQPKRTQGLWNLEESLAELAELARTANAEVVGSIHQRLGKATPFYLGAVDMEEYSPPTFPRYFIFVS